MLDIKPGSIIFYHGTSPLSEAIEFLDGSSFSHVCVAMPHGSIVESQYFTNTRIVNNHYDEDKITVLDLGLTDEQIEKLIHCSFQYLEDKYDLKQILGLAFHYIFKVDTNISWNDPKLLICSELVVNLLYSVGYITDDEFKLLRNSTPSILYKFLINKINKTQSA